MDRAIAPPKIGTSVFLPALLLFSLAGLPLLLAIVLPFAPECVSRAASGLPCPGCGLGRALSALFALEFKEALIHYPPLAAIVAGYLLAWGWTVGAFWGHPSAQWRVAATAVGFVLIAGVFGHWGVQLVGAIV